MQALERLMARIGAWPPVVVGHPGLRRERRAHAAADAGRRFPGEAGLAGRAGAHLRAGRQGSGAPRSTTEAQIYTFLPAVGGAGVTTLAVQSAMMLLNSGQRGKASTCLVDLDFQHGACADYLDLEPRLNLGEIEPRPERLDRQLLEVMLSHHPSGLAVVAAPNRPAEMRSFDPDVVTRLLDLVSSHFDYVVFDMPRTWFSWTDSVLLGSNKLFIVSEMTVPGLRHAKQLVEAIRERLGDGPQPQVIINRFEQRLFSSGLRKADIEQVLGDSFAACIPNHYGLVREAIDRGVPLDEVKPGNKITLQLRKLILPQPAAKARAAPARRRGEETQTVLGALTRRTTEAGSRNENGRPFHRTTRCCRRNSCRSRSRRRRSKACPGRCFPSPAPSRSPRRPPIRCSATSCSTPRSACTAG